MQLLAICSRRTIECGCELLLAMRMLALALALARGERGATRERGGASEEGGATRERGGAGEEAADDEHAPPVEVAREAERELPQPCEARPRRACMLMSIISCTTSVNSDPSAPI